jgi:hypothetical protein
MAHHTFKNACDRPGHLLSREEVIAALREHGPIHAGVFTYDERESVYRDGTATLISGTDKMVLRERTLVHGNKRYDQTTNERFFAQCSWKSYSLTHCEDIFAACVINR